MGVLSRYLIFNFSRRYNTIPREGQRERKRERERNTEQNDPCIPESNRHF